MAKLKKDDTVIVIFPSHVVGVVGRDAIVRELADDKRPYWELENVETGTTFVVPIPVLMRRV